MLEINGLSKRYGDKVALDGLSFSVPPAQMFGFVGRNGAGKTTTMRIILGVLTPDSGEVRWQGQPADADLHRRIGYMPEERGLYPKMRVHDQLVYLARLHDVPVERARDSADHWLEVLGLSDRRRDRVEALSLGNQQRVQLAAALVHQPEILVLDEPFSGLDPVGVDVLAEALQERVAAGVPVIFSSHQLDLVERLCDSVGIIEDGRLVATGTVSQLRGSGRARRLRIRVEGADGAWVLGVSGAEVVTSDGSTTVVELAAGTDEQQVLQAALGAGDLREFTPLEPSLADLFREAVAA